MRFAGTVILEQGFETLCGREVFESQRALAAVLAPQHAVGVTRTVLLGVDACHNPRCYVICYVDPGTTLKMPYELRKCCGAKGTRTPDPHTARVKTTVLGRSAVSPE